MDITFSTPGALIGLAIAIFLIIKKVHPAYSLIFGALIGGLIGGGGLHATGGSVYMSINERAKLIPYEAMIGLTSTVAATVIYLLGF